LPTTNSDFQESVSVQNIIPNVAIFVITVFHQCSYKCNQPNLLNRTMRAAPTMSLKQRVLDKLGFTKKTLIRFIVIALGSQFIYSINAIRVVLYDPFRESMGISNTQMGFLFSLLGLVGLFALILDRNNPKAMFAPRGYFSLGSYYCPHSLCIK